MMETIIRKPVPYVCPKCRCPLQSTVAGFHCNHCRQTYPSAHTIPDFIVTDSHLQRTYGSWLWKAHRMFFDLLAPIYESWIWYQLTLNLSGARGSSIRSISNFVAQTLEGIDGRVLDAACGPVTYGRRIASPAREIYGIDVSSGMLRQGMTYLRRDRISNVHLARARVEELPFPDDFFDGAICAGSLHLFPEPRAALSEIKRVMKPGAPIAIQTFTPDGPGDTGSLNRTGVHHYHVSELWQCLAEVGFIDTAIQSVGSVVTVSTRKRG